MLERVLYRRDFLAMMTSSIKQTINIDSNRDGKTNSDDVMILDSLLIDVVFRDSAGTTRDILSGDGGRRMTYSKSSSSRAFSTFSR